MSLDLNLPLVSIVITSYNYEKYIRDALNSVSKQTYRPLECIVVDDCSTDHSVEVITKAFNDFRQIGDGIEYSLVSTEKNSGQMAAFQLGISKARGVFINFLDADDYLFPDFVSVHVQVHLENLVAFTFTEPIEIDSSRQVHSFRSNSGDGYGMLGMSRKNFTIYPFDDYRQKLDTDFNEVEFNSEQWILDRTQLKWNMWHWYPTSSALFRKSSLLSLCEINPEKWRICADALLFCYAQIIGNSCFIPFHLSTYRRHGNNGFALDSVVGQFRYITDKAKNFSAEMFDWEVPLSLLHILASFKEKSPSLSMDLMKAVIYHAGPDFLLHNWSVVFSYIQMTFTQRLMLLLKTYVRHSQLEKKWKQKIKPLF